MTTMTTKTVNVCGDVLEIHWTGSVWVSPHNGQQHSRDTQAMRSELEAYFRSCGDDLDDEDVQQSIADYLSQMAGLDRDYVE